MVYPALLLLMRTPRLPVVDWTDAPPADLNGLVRFARKTNSGFCACAITFQTQSKILNCVLNDAQIGLYQIKITHYFNLARRCKWDLRPFGDFTQRVTPKEHKYKLVNTLNYSDPIRKFSSNYRGKVSWNMVIIIWVLLLHNWAG